MDTEITSWGRYWVLDEASTHKVTRIIINSNEHVRYPYHYRLSKAWTIVDGVGRITIDEVVRDYQVGNVIIIPQGVKYQIQNLTAGLLIFIEVESLVLFWKR